MVDKERLQPLMSDLMELAARCEKATAEQQRELLLEAFETLTAAFVATPSAIKFVRMLDAEAYESAAMTLVPEGTIWEVGHKVNYPKAKGEPDRANYAFVNVGRPGEVKTFSGKSVATPALALCAAALRARAAQ